MRPSPRHRPAITRPSVEFAELFTRSRDRRAALAAMPHLSAFRLFDGSGDGLAGVYVDRYGPVAILNVYDDSRWPDEAITQGAETILESLQSQGVMAVYVKRFARDRSRLGGRAPAESSAPEPRAGTAQPESLIVEERGVRFEVRPYDGFSTGLFLEHREHRRALSERGVSRVLNLFAYTCAFSVPLTLAGASVTNVDVSSRYLDWGRRNHALNGAMASSVRYVRMDAAAYLAYASKHADERFDLVILDPPTFGAGNPRRGIKPWKSTTGYPALLTAASKVLTPDGLIFAATNTRELAADDALRDIVQSALGDVRWHPLPPWPEDVREKGRVAAVLFSRR